MRSEPLTESAATVENMDLISSTPGLANRLISPVRCSVLSERDVELHMIKAFCCLINLVADECLSAWCWVKRPSCRRDRTTDLIFHYVFYFSHFLGRHHTKFCGLQNAADQESIKKHKLYIS